MNKSGFQLFLAGIVVGACGLFLLWNHYGSPFEPIGGNGSGGAPEEMLHLMGRLQEDNLRLQEENRMLRDRLKAVEPASREDQDLSRITPLKDPLERPVPFSEDP